MSSDETESDSVNEHYTPLDLDAKILRALTAAGKDPDRLTIDDLMPIDEFHVRGRKATVELARDLGLDKNMQVLDVGSGLGGAARYLAHTFGCRVTGLDLNTEYCSVATTLTRLLGLETLV